MALEALCTSSFSQSSEERALVATSCVNEASEGFVLFLQSGISFVYKDCGKSSGPICPMVCAGHE